MFYDRDKNEDHEKAWKEIDGQALWPGPPFLLSQDRDERLEFTVQFKSPPALLEEPASESPALSLGNLTLNLPLLVDTSDGGGM